MEEVQEEEREVGTEEVEKEPKKSNDDELKKLIMTLLGSTNKFYEETRIKLAENRERQKRIKKRISDWMKKTVKLEENKEENKRMHKENKRIITSANK